VELRGDHCRSTPIFCELTRAHESSRHFSSGFSWSNRGRIQTREETILFLSARRGFFLRDGKTLCFPHRLPYGLEDTRAIR